MQGELDRIGIDTLKLEAGMSTDDVIEEIKKKDEVINEMSKYVNSPLRIPEEEYCEFYHSDEDCCWKTDKDCKDCIKEYFTNKVEREGK